MLPPCVSDVEELNGATAMMLSPSNEDQVSGLLHRARQAEKRAQRAEEALAQAMEDLNKLKSVHHSSSLFDHTVCIHSFIHTANMALLNYLYVFFPLSLKCKFQEKSAKAFSVNSSKFIALTLSKAVLHLKKSLN